MELPITKNRPKMVVLFISYVRDLPFVLDSI